MPAPYSMTLGLTIFSLLAFVLIFRTSMDPVPGKMHMTYITPPTHTHSPLHTVSVGPWSPQIPYRVFGPTVNHFCHMFMFIRSIYTVPCRLVSYSSAGDIDTHERQLLPQGAGSLVERDGLVHGYLPPELQMLR